MYECSDEHLRAEFERLERLLDRAVSDGGSRIRDTGAATRPILTDGLPDSADGSADVPDEQVGISELTATIDENVTAAREHGIELRFDKLTHRFDLTRADRDALLVVLAPEFEPSITETYGRLAGSNQPRFPTTGLVKRVLASSDNPCRDESSTASPSPLSPSAPLFEHGILERAGRDRGHPVNATALSVTPRIVRYLEGDDTLDSTLQHVATLERHDRTLADLVFDEETTTALEAIDRRSSRAGSPTIYYVSGEDGTGKDRLPAALTDDDTPVLRAEAMDVLADDDTRTRLIREAALQDAAIHLESLEAVTNGPERPVVDSDGDGADGTLEAVAADRPSVDELVERLDDAPGDVFLSHTDEWTPDVELTNHRLEIVHCPFPDRDVRLAVWNEYGDEFADPGLLAHVATNFRLPQRDIRRAVRTARHCCRTDGDADAESPGSRQDEVSDPSASFAPVDGTLTREHVYEACKRYSASDLEELAEEIEPGYTWDDLVLNDRQQTHLEELCGHLQYRGPVTSEWGFGEPGDRGDGVVALFYGEPGTGKTMAAEVIATETGLDLYRVDLSQVINKYVGETESRLATVLEEAERSNAILLFDEADAIFGKRAEVKDATDRYANTEINYLLQRLESFDGILLLTTNKRSGIDSAFKRRIDHSIEFQRPQELIRRDLWREAFPDLAAVDDSDFDYEFLGRISTTPASIRKVAKYAAYIAATEAHDGEPLDGATALSDVTITFDHVIRALQYAREAGGAGFEIDFGEYADRRRSYDTHGVDRDWREELRKQYSTDPDSTTERKTGAESSAEKATADAVDPGDDRSPEQVVEEFYARLRAADERAHDLYHSATLAEEYSHKELRLMAAGDIAVVSQMRRTRDDHDRVVLEFDQRLSGPQVPDELDGESLPIRFELRPEPAGWRIFNITRLESNTKRP